MTEHTAMNNSTMKEMEGARRATGISFIEESLKNRLSGSVPDPEVSAKPVRRKYTAEYKLRILKEAESCMARGAIGALLRREGLYSSNLITWQHQRDRGTLDALSPKKRGPKKYKNDPSLQRIAALEKENQILWHRLKQAETIIEAQKKIAEILQMPDDLPEGKKP